MFKITITEIKATQATKRGEYGVLDRVPWTAETFAEEQIYGGREEFLKRCPLKEIFGYRPSYEDIERIETKILEQTVDELDLAAVIKAVNKL